MENKIMFTLRDLKDKIDNLNDNVLDTPLVVGEDYFEKYLLMPYTLTRSYGDIGEYSTLRCKILPDHFEGYTDLMISLKNFQRLEKIYKTSIKDYFREYNYYINNIELKYSARYGDTLKFKVDCALNSESLIGFVKQFKYRMPVITVKKISQHDVYHIYTFSKLTPKLEEILNL